MKLKIVITDSRDRILIEMSQEDLITILTEYSKNVSIDKAVQRALSEFKKQTNGL